MQASSINTAAYDSFKQNVLIYQHNVLFLWYMKPQASHELGNYSMNLFSFEGWQKLKLQSPFVGHNLFLPQTLNPKP